jgi:hypothetical protein
MDAAGANAPLMSAWQFHEPPEASKYTCRNVRCQVQTQELPVDVDLPWFCDDCCRKDKRRIKRIRHRVQRICAVLGVPPVRVHKVVRWYRKNKQMYYAPHIFMVHEEKAAGGVWRAPRKCYNVGRPIQGFPMVMNWIRGGCPSLQAGP